MAPSGNDSDLCIQEFSAENQIILLVLDFPVYSILVYLILNKVRQFIFQRNAWRVECVVK